MKFTYDSRPWYMTASSVTTTGVVTLNNEVVWSNWNDKRRQVLTYALSRAQDTWVSWNIAHTVSNIVSVDVTTGSKTIRVTPTPPPTAEQIRAREQENARRAAEMDRMRQEQVRLDGEKKEAKEKAEKLLQSALALVQREELNKNGFFHCRSNKGNLYRIYRGSHGNIRKIVGDKEVERICVQPSYVPEGDCMLAQKLHIESDEDTFRGTANILTIH